MQIIEQVAKLIFIFAFFCRGLVLEAFLCECTEMRQLLECRGEGHPLAQEERPGIDTDLIIAGEQMWESLSVLPRGNAKQLTECAAEMVDA